MSFDLFISLIAQDVGEPLTPFLTLAQPKAFPTTIKYGVQRFLKSFLFVFGDAINDSLLQVLLTELNWI